MATIKLLQFPYLVQKAVIGRMDLHEAFGLSTVSRKMRRIVKISLTRTNLYLRYCANEYFEFTRRLSAPDDGSEYVYYFTMKLKNQMDQNMVYPYQFWNLLNHDSVPMRVFSEGSQTIVESFWPNKLYVGEGMVEYFLDLFSNYTFCLSFKPIPTIDLFRRSMQLIKNVEDLDLIEIHPHRRDRRNQPPNDELYALVLDMSRRSSILCLDMKTTDEFTYDSLTHAPFFFKNIYLEDARWITRDHFIKLFLNCKAVNLSMISLTDEDLTAILEEWSQNSPMQYMALHGHDGYYRQGKLDNVVGHLPGAIPVEKASMKFPGDQNNRLEIRRVSFSEGRCYRINGPDDGKVLVFYIDDSFFLNHDFEIIESDEILPNVDE